MTEVSASEQNLATTRTALHAVAEWVLAGVQHRAAGTIRLQVTPGGFATLDGGLRVDGVELVVTTDEGVARLPLQGTLGDLGMRAGLQISPPADVYADTAEASPETELDVDPACAAVIADWFGRGHQGLVVFAPDQQPVLWPEHFDLGISVDEVNYGISPGDGHRLDPYAYVGPWTPRPGEFWNESFGAARSANELVDVAAVVGFFEAGRAAAASS